MNTETKLEFEIIYYDHMNGTSSKTGDVLIVSQSNIHYVIEHPELDFNTIGLSNGKEYRVCK